MNKVFLGVAFVIVLVVYGLPWFTLMHAATKYLQVAAEAKQRSLENPK